MNLPKTLLIAGCCFIVALCMAIYRDVTIYERAGAPDLRNRIVGARLQQDGISPYFYRWQPGEPVRYYDISNIGDSGISNITATPFFHSLLYPVANFQQRTISYIWLALEYLFVLAAGIIAFRLAANNVQKLFVLTGFTLFLFTEAWASHIVCGQLYLLLPLLTMIIYYCFTRKEKLSAAFIGGLTAIVLLLIRPNAAVFFVPFLLLAKSYSRKYLAVFILPMILLPAIYFSFENNRNYWSAYLKAIPEVVKQHQTDLPDAAAEQTRLNQELHKLAAYEGWNAKEIVEHEKKTNLVVQSENGNVFVFYKLLLHRKMSVGLMSLLSGLSIVVLLILFYLLGKRSGSITLPNIALLGYCLYMIVDLFSPVYRHQYYGVQWLFPLLLAASAYKPANKWFYVALLAGLWLNVINTGLIKMEHSLGEYLMLITLLVLSISRKLSHFPNKV